MCKQNLEWQGGGEGEVTVSSDCFLKNLKDVTHTTCSEIPWWTHPSSIQSPTLSLALTALSNMVTTCLKQKHPRRIAAYFLFGRNTIFFVPTNTTCWGGTYTLVFSDSWTQYRHWTIQIYGLNFKCLASTCCPHAAAYHGTLCGLLFCVVRRSSDFVEKDVWKEQFLFHNSR